MRETDRAPIAAGSAAIDSGKLCGEFFSLQTLPGYLCNGYNQVGKLQT
jgi:hypothetical protein